MTRVPLFLCTPHYPDAGLRDLLTPALGPPFPMHSSAIPFSIPLPPSLSPSSSIGLPVPCHAPMLQAVIRAILSNCVDGDIFQLVHLSNGFHLYDGAQSIAEGDVIDTAAAITGLTVSNGNVMVYWACLLPLRGIEMLPSEAPQCFWFSSIFRTVAAMLVLSPAAERLSCMARQHLEGATLFSIVASPLPKHKHFMQCSPFSEIDDAQGALYPEVGDGAFKGPFHLCNAEFSFLEPSFTSNGLRHMWTMAPFQRQ